MVQLIKQLNVLDNAGTGYGIIQGDIDASNFFGYDDVESMMQQDATAIKVWNLYKQDLNTWYNNPKRSNTAKIAPRATIQYMPAYGKSDDPTKANAGYRIIFNPDWLASKKQGSNTASGTGSEFGALTTQEINSLTGASSVEDGVKGTAGISFIIPQEFDANTKSLDNLYYSNVETAILAGNNGYAEFDMPEDRWVRGSQIIAGDRTVLHHTVNRLDFPGESGRRFLGGSGNRDKASITAYIPGDTPDLDPPNTGGLVKAGSTLHLNMHYTPNGRETVDRSQLGVWFYPLGEEPEERMSGRCACVFPNTWTTIPAHDPAFEQTASIIIENDAHIHSYLPHMHFRGKRMRFFADYPDGTTEELINVAKYNYNWQLSYTYEEPKFVPGGTKITAVAAWDNSSQNPSNPNPDRNVDWGNESWDEMFFGAVNWKNVDQGGED